MQPAMQVDVACSPPVAKCLLRVPVRHHQHHRATHTLPHSRAARKLFPLPTSRPPPLQPTLETCQAPRLASGTPSPPRGLPETETTSRPRETTPMFVQLLKEFMGRKIGERIDVSETDANALVAQQIAQPVTDDIITPAVQKAMEQAFSGFQGRKRGRGRKRGQRTFWLPILPAWTIMTGMARTLRVALRGYCYHILNPGKGRSTVFLK